MTYGIAPESQMANAAYRKKYTISQIRIDRLLGRGARCLESTLQSHVDRGGHREIVYRFLLGYQSVQTDGHYFW